MGICQNRSKKDRVSAKSSTVRRHTLDKQPDSCYNIVRIYKEKVP